MRWAWWIRAALALSTLTSALGCRGCEKEPSELARYASKDAEAYAEILDLGIWFHRRAFLDRLQEGLVTPEQRLALEEELRRQLGFDPTSAAGLKAAGFAEKGGLGLELASSGRSLLWIIPAGDAGSLTKTVQRLLETNLGAKKTIQKSLAGHSATLLVTPYGAEEIVRGGWVRNDGLVLAAVGPETQKLLLGALSQTRENSLLANPEYSALLSELLRADVLRIYAPSAGGLAKNLIDRLPLRTNREVLERELRSAGFGLGIDDRGVTVLGSVHFLSPGIERLKKVFRPMGAGPALVLAADAKDAVLTVSGSADPLALVASLREAGPDAAQSLERFLRFSRERLELDFEQLVLPRLSGHASAALGIVDLSALSRPQDILRNPAGAFWLAVLAGASGDAPHSVLGQIYAKVDSKLAEAQITRTERATSEGSVSQFSHQERPLFETFFAHGAYGFTNQPGATDALFLRAKSPPSDPQQGKPGLRLLLRFAPLLAGVSQLDLDRLGGGGAGALIARSMAAKLQAALRQLDRLELSVSPGDRGLLLSGRLSLAQPAGNP